MDIDLDEALGPWELEISTLERLLQGNSAEPLAKDRNSTQGSSMLGSPERKWEVLPLVDWPLLGFPCEFGERKGRVRRYVACCRVKRRRERRKYRLRGK